VLGILGLIAGGIMAIGFFTASMSSCGLAFAWSLPDYCCLHFNRMLFTGKSIDTALAAIEGRELSTCQNL
jgi:hypothetical protein